ncbi:MAG: hypothetical protein JWN44_2555 [Myxococcales bacterium]|nr:hypothetical protein [Myxococcales bacterium]
MRALAAATILLCSSLVAAAGGDYKLDSREWNGLGRLADEAAAAGCTMTAVDTLDWSAVESRDAVWFVYPRTAVDGGLLRRYLEAGGRAVLADDFGASDAALAALEIRRLRGELPSVTRYDENPALPIARQSMSTELSAGIPALIANHPAFFSAATPSTYAFSPGAALVVEGRLGKGYFVALADPSVLINNMLDLDENLAFARSLVRRTCKSGERILLVTQSFTSRGEPSGELSPPTATDPAFVRFNRMIEAINDAARAAVDGRLLAVLATLMAMVALGLWARAWPARGRVDGHWTRAPAPAAVAWEAWDLPTTAAFLRDELALRLSESLGASVAGLAPAELRRRVTRVHGPRVALAAARLWAGLRGPPTWISRRRLAKMQAAAAALFDVIGPREQG